MEDKLISCTCTKVVLFAYGYNLQVVLYPLLFLTRVQGTTHLDALAVI